MATGDQDELSQGSSRAPDPDVARAPNLGSVKLSPSLQYPDKFPIHWQNSTSDDPLTLFAFRRFRTGQLLNLRFLEDEIATLDNQIFQAGLKLGVPIEGKDNLGLKKARLDPKALDFKEVITSGNVQRLRNLLKEYNEALLSLNSIMFMEQCTMTDSAAITSQQTSLTNQSAYTTRLLRVDLPLRSSKDPLRSTLYQWLRAFHFRRSYGQSYSDLPIDRRRTDLNTTMLADITARFLVALLAGTFLVIPLVILNFQSNPRAHLLTVSICIVVFSFLVSLGTKASNQETMVASAGYAAVLVVFVASSPNPKPT